MPKYYYPRIREIRKSRNKNQQEIAEVLNITYQYYSAYERGVRDIPTHHVKTLAKYYNLSVDYILGLVNEEKKIDASNKFESQKYHYQRIRDTREDRDKTQQEIAEVLNTTHQYYSAYERGIRDIPIHHIKTLAKYYNISADYLIGLSDEEKAFD